MLSCPHCRTEISVASKSWPVNFGKERKEGEPELIMGIFECPNCKSKFRSTIKKDFQQTSTASVRELVDRIRIIREGFVQTLNTLREKINTLQRERSTLLSEAEELKKAAESRADALENEVGRLRQKLRSLRELLDSGSVQQI